MPSFSTEVKNELARLVYNRMCCQKAELAGLLRMGASLIMGFSSLGGEKQRTVGISFVTENAAVARKVLNLIKSISKGKVITEVTVSRSRRLKKNNRYSLRAVPSPQVRDLLVSIGLMKGNILNVGSDTAVIKKQCCRIAYLRGAFMGGGSVNRPEASCHLEFVTGSYTFGATLHGLLKKMYMPAGFTDRHNDYVIYVKDGETIMDLLWLMEAEKSVEAIEVARNIKEVRTQVNRIVNCETANLQKTVMTSIHHIEIIDWLEKQGILENLPAKLKESAKARQENPDASLGELAEIVGISKSGMNHRLKKLEEIFNKAKEGK